jgi:Kef-type K+ transport system membrane component KefB
MPVFLVYVMHELQTTIGFQTSLLLLVALGGYLLAAMTNQSAVVGQIILGIIIGPSVFGLITYSGFVSNLAYLGAVILLFVIGLEFKLKDIMGGNNAFIALFGVVVPWAFAYFTAYIFGFSHHTSIFVGTALTATSIAITANVLHEMGALKTPLAKTIIGAAVIDDILALFALTVTTKIMENTISFNNITFLAFKIVVFFGVGLLAGYFLFLKLIYKVDNSKFGAKHPEFIFFLAVTICFLYVLVAEMFGISAIIGAFVSGVFLEGVTLKQSRHFSEGADYLRIIFASIFFVSLGILVELQGITMTTFWFLITLTFTGYLSKILGCGLAAKICQYNWKESLTIGAGMAPRGEVAMIIALIGIKKEIISQPVYVCIVLMSLLTTIITPIILKKLLQTKSINKHITI